MRCPPPLVLFHFAQGTVSPDVRRRIEGHVARCPTCSEQVARASTESGARRAPSRPPPPPKRSPVDATRNLGPASLPDFDDDSATRVNVLGSPTPAPPSMDDARTVAPPPGRPRPPSRDDMAVAARRSSSSRNDMVAARPRSPSQEDMATVAPPGKEPRPPPDAATRMLPTGDSVPPRRPSNDSMPVVRRRSSNDSMPVVRRRPSNDSMPIVHDSGALTMGASVSGSQTPIASAFETSPATGRAELPRGTQLGRYMVVEPLGSGGLGDVYTAYDPDLDRCVAVKVLRPSLDHNDSWDASGSGTGTGSGSDRLIREAKALARLAHPNVVSVYDVGRLGDDVFIAMERVEGMTLSQWNRSGEHTWKEVRDVFLGAGQGLAAAHDAGIVHRDFKPGNVIVGPDGRPRVLDFGLARAVRNDEGSGLIALPRLGELPADSLDGSVTMEGTVMGTPQYMAPEQFEGSANTGPPADQFAFCVALFESLYGQRPFQSESIPGLVAAVRSGEVTDPPDRRGVPKWMHKLLLRGLSTDPEARFDSMHSLLYAMQRDRRSRRRQWIGLGVVAVLSGLGAAGAALFLRPPVTEEHRTQVQILSDEARDAAARSYFVYPAPDDQDTVTAYRKVLELEAIEGPAEDLADERADELRAEMAATLTRLGDRYYEREGGRAFAADYYAAALVFEEDNDHARSRTSLTPGEIAELRRRAAEGRFDPAELQAAASLVVLAEEDEQQRHEKLLALYQGDQAPSISTAARIEALLGEEAEAIAEALRPPEPEPPPPEPEPPPPEPEPELLDATEGGTGGETEGGTAGAASEIEEPAPETIPSKRDPALARALAKQGAAAFKRGDFPKAESLFHRALEHDRRSAAALGGLAELYFERGSYQKATQYAGKAVAAAPRNGKYRIVLGDAHFKSLAYGSARREYEKAKALGHPSAAGRLSLLDKRLGQ